MTGQQCFGLLKIVESNMTKTVEIKRSVGENIRSGREKKSISQKKLAETLGVSQPTVSDWERGRKVPGLVHAWKMAIEMEIQIFSPIT